MKKNPSDHPTEEQILKFLFSRADFEHDYERLGPGRYEVERQLMPIVCWKCPQPLAAVRGYRTRGEVTVAYSGGERSAIL